MVTEATDTFINTDDRFERLIRCAFRGRLNFKAFEAAFKWRPEQLSCRLKMLSVLFFPDFVIQTSFKLPLLFSYTSLFHLRILNR